MSYLSRAGQTGILLEVFILVLILILFTMFWSPFYRTTFLAGLLAIDDRSFEHTCANMVQVVIGTDYIINYEGGEVVTQSLVDYLGFSGLSSQVPDAKYFYDKILSSFPALEGRVGVRVIPSMAQGEGFDAVEGFTCNEATVFFTQAYRCATCEFPLYSLDDELTGLVVMEVLI